MSLLDQRREFYLKVRDCGLKLVEAQRIMMELSLDKPTIAALGKIIDVICDRERDAHFKFTLARGGEGEKHEPTN